MPIGAEILPGGAGVHFRVWAPRHTRVHAVTRDGGRELETALVPERRGYFSGTVASARDGARYGFRLGDDDTVRPDPASRSQPDGVHGPSRVVDPNRFAWTDAAWRGVRLEGAVIYELHIGTFTAEGTYASAAEQLEWLRELGVTVIELMPVAQFPGRFGWGYDGVNLFAPTHQYGSPDELRRFVDRAHALGLGMILDVVYNHFGPDGNYLGQYSSDFVTSRHRNEWGDAIDFDGPNSHGVREFFVANARYWIDEYHFDGLRLDATQSIFDDSPKYILIELEDAVRDAAKGRQALLIGENEPQDPRLIRSRERGGLGLDAAWNDDFHHTARVALTGQREAYYQDYTGSPQSFVSAIKHGYLFQGQRYAWQRKGRGTAARDIAPAAFVSYLENHDQVANSFDGARLHQLSQPGRLRALTTLLLLGPGTPMLFQGQEYASTRPFLYFADHNPELAQLVARGRAEFLAQFPSIAVPSVRQALRDPHAPETFARCVLDVAERAHRPEVVALHRDLIRLRREDPVLAAQGAHGIDGAVLGAETFAIRFFGPDPSRDRLLVVNLGPQLQTEGWPEPLTAPPAHARWLARFDSEDPRYGGRGAPETVDPEGRWNVAGQCAVLLAPGETWTVGAGTR